MGEEVLYVQFNQDYSSLAVGTGGEWTLVSLTSLEALDRIHEASAPDGVQIVERLFSSSLVAIVSLKSPRKLRVCHFKKGNEICNYSYQNTILGVRLNRARLVVCLENMLYIHNIRDMKILHTIRDTPLNEKGILALSINADNSFLAYPGSSSTGQVQVFDAFNLQAKIVIHAHASSLAALAFNLNGTLLATASSKGTVIRVFSTTDGSRLFEFRRGMKRRADIYSISFSPDNSFLAMSSNTETVHVFRLESANQSNEVKEELASPAASWMEWVKSSLPTQVTEVWAQGRSFATITTPFVETRSVVAVITVTEADGPKTRVIVGSYDGFLYVYGLNTQEGGECQLLKQYKLTGTGSDAKKCPSSSGPAGTASYAGVVKDSDKMLEMKNAIDQAGSSEKDFPTLE
ncbi:WD repeat domain phosphoinositide-interacting protein 2 isoform X2 [Folsomia candida]|uniref:WD repeat domain phosphoinositide-interacting protein 2 isoform X2 n=1 Tax=Folsomia candida TaxID=158441 RepID=UPI000B8FBF7D|nr:WD repeat domain phosphoinositide-interacting protein 2 isoform X2 [Folsomia candida]